MLQNSLENWNLYANQMSNLFRSFRHSLIQKYLMGKYIKYALGEIILVVIGILIALQINNWNQSMKDQKLEQQYYCRLLEDVKQDYSNYNTSVDLLNEKLEANNTLLQKLLDDTMPLDSISPYILASVKLSNMDAIATTNAFDDIKSSGNLNIIKDFSLKEKLTSYYESLESTSSVIESNGKSVTDKRFFMSEELISSGWIQMLEGFGEIDTSKVSLKKLQSKVNFTEEVRSNMTNDAIFYLGINSRNKQLMQSLEMEILSMISLLEGKCKNEDE